MSDSFAIPWFTAGFAACAVLLTWLFVAGLTNLKNITVGSAAVLTIVQAGIVFCLFYLTDDGGALA